MVDAHLQACADSLRRVLPYSVCQGIGIGDGELVGYLIHEAKGLPVSVNGVPIRYVVTGEVRIDSPAESR